VTSEREVLGRWTVVTVLGQAPPADAIPGLLLGRASRQALDGPYFAGYDDGLNGHSVAWHLGTDGRFVTGSRSMTMVGCSKPNCTRPSGFGVTGEATELRLTANNELLFVDRDGRELARYVRAEKVLAPGSGSP
jgi:hypothetical protein